MSAIGPGISPQRLQTATHNKCDGEDDSYGPVLPTQSGRVSDTEEEEDESLYTPALPPDLRAPKRTKRTLGPTMPPPASHAHQHDSGSDEEVGPMPAPAPTNPHGNNTANDAVREFVEREERRRRADEDRQAAKPKREEWMLVPPSSSSVLGSLDPTKLKPRQFSRSTNASLGTRDSSLWTETPAERQIRLKDEVDGKRRRATDVSEADDDFKRVNKRHKHEAVVKSQVEEYNRQTRGRSLVDIHQSSETKDKEKDQGFSVIWDHARDMSVGGRLMDEGQRSKMINEARTLNDKFGKSKDGGFL